MIFNIKNEWRGIFCVGKHVILGFKQNQTEKIDLNDFRNGFVQLHQVLVEHSINLFIEDSIY
jgi:hypothetical protein